LKNYAPPSSQKKKHIEAGIFILMLEYPQIILYFIVSILFIEAGIFIQTCNGLALNELIKMFQSSS